MAGGALVLALEPDEPPATTPGGVMRLLCSIGSDHGLTVSRCGGALPMDTCPIVVAGACTGGLELERLTLAGQLGRGARAERGPALGRLLAERVESGVVVPGIVVEERHTSSLAAAREGQRVG